EEWKMMNETKKIMGENKLKVVATCVRIPVISGHSESVYIEEKQADASVSAIQELMAQAPGVILQDEPSEQLYRQALNSV
ncbi:Asd/ArgC dimerization domain-containing protein, partial [Enterococcus faecalis]|uniref:Asd/ArgC dimerization domain-containing protein n=1 Tax=Enterococcus faecalis TaxID=1351 RepID=UPI003CC5F5B0